MKCLILAGVLGLCGIGVAEYGVEQPLGVAWRGDGSRAPFDAMNEFGVEGSIVDESFEEETLLDPTLIDLPLSPPNGETSSSASYFDYDQSSTSHASSSAHTSKQEDIKDSEPLPPWAVTYAPYTSRGSCKSPSQMEHDLKRIASRGFSAIRLHSPDCSVLYFIGPIAKKHNISLILGIYVPAPFEPSSDEDSSTHSSSQTVSQVQAQIEDIITWAQGDYSQVEMIVLGDEAIFNDFITADSLATIISDTREELRDAGYQGPVTTTEPVMTLIENARQLCPVLDVLAANIQPYFNHHVAPHNAGPYLTAELLLLSYTCDKTRGSLPSYSMETGWPKEGVANGEAVAGVDEQWIAMNSILKQGEDVVRRTVLGSWEDEEWREEGEWGCERSWGLEGALESAL